MRVINVDDDPKSKKKIKESENDFSHKNKSPLPKLNQTNSLKNIENSSQK